VSATAWDRAHAKSCWARRNQLTDVVSEMYQGPGGVFSLEALPRSFSEEQREAFSARFREFLKSRSVGGPT
jgi:hypothetical protein